jgi:hypothetical protein
MPKTENLPFAFRHGEFTRLQSTESSVLGYYDERADSPVHFGVLATELAAADYGVVSEKYTAIRLLFYHFAESTEGSSWGSARHPVVPSRPENVQIQSFWNSFADLTSSHATLQRYGSLSRHAVFKYADYFYGLAKVQAAGDARDALAKRWTAETLRNKHGKTELPETAALTFEEGEQLVTLVRKAQLSSRIYDEVLAYVRAVQLSARPEQEAKRVSPQPQVRSSGGFQGFFERIEGTKQPEVDIVLETYDGFVDRIEGDTAFVTLQSRANGDVEEGTYTASELAKMGIHEHSCFVFKTLRTESGLVPVIEACRNQAIADEVVREIDAKIDQALPSEDSGIKY